MSEQENPLFVVTGMHRSGTSALAGALHRCGAALGEGLLQPQQDNPSGFFELESVVRAHDHILAMLGQTWDDPRPVNLNLLDRSARTEARRLLVDIIEGALPPTGIRVVKDPRASRLLPLWLEVFAEIGVVPRFVHLVRPWPQVHESLHRRSAFSKDKSLALWNDYNFSMEAATRGELRCFVLFDELLDDPVSVAERIASDLKFEWHRPPAMDRTTMEAFVEPGRPRRSTNTKAPVSATALLKHLSKLRSADTKATRDAIDKLRTADPGLPNVEAYEHASELHLRITGELTSLRQQLDDRTDWLRVVAASTEATTSKFEASSAEFAALAARFAAFDSLAEQLRAEATSSSSEVQRTIDKAREDLEQELQKRTEELGSRLGQIDAAAVGRGNADMLRQDELRTASADALAKETAALERRLDEVVSSRQAFEVASGNDFATLDSAIKDVAAELDTAASDRAELGKQLEGFVEALQQQLLDALEHLNGLGNRLDAFYVEIGLLGRFENEISSVEDRIGRHNEVLSQIEDRIAVVGNGFADLGDRVQDVEEMVSAQHEAAGTRSESTDDARFEEFGLAIGKLKDEVSGHLAAGDFRAIDDRVEVLSSALRILEDRSKALDTRQNELQGWSDRIVSDQRSHAATIVRLQREFERFSRPSSARVFLGRARRAPRVLLERRRLRKLRAQAIDASSSVVDTPATVANNSSPTSTMTGQAQAPLSCDSSGLSFDECVKPVVSIVIPVFNQTAVTLQCLRSLHENPPSIPFEVIVANDCSTESEFDVLREIDGLIVVDAQENGGFVKNCNSGAAQASGRYLFFLNNDTEVTDRAIDRLIDTFDLFPRTGIAGSKLLFPDGTVQDGGGLVWNDGSAWNYGRGKLGDEPTLNYCRAVDYVAGAALMITKALFDEVGGFDELYAPAYYEDTDLCMKIKQRGLEVRYQPTSVVYHDEGTSYGTDTNQQGKHNQLINHKKFTTRWHEALSTHAPNAVNPESEKERNIDQRILLIDARMLTPDQDAGSLRMANLLRIMTLMGHKVTFIPNNLQSMEPYGEMLRRDGVEVFTEANVRSVAEFLEQRGKEFNTVILSRLEVVQDQIENVRRYCPQATVAFDTVDLHFLRERRELEVTGASTLPRSHLDTYQAETNAMRATDVTLVCSRAEVDLLRDEVPGVDVHLVASVHDEPMTETAPEDREGIMFVGGFEHPPNVDAVKWFVTEVHPLIVEQRPGTIISIVGSKVTPEIAALESDHVRVLGFVQDLGPLYESNRVVVAPVRFGAGVKGKVTQAMARGVPCVATSIAIEGMPENTHQSVALADTPEDFALATLSVLRDDELWRQLRKGGRQVIDKDYSFPALEERIRPWLLRTN